MIKKNGFIETSCANSSHLISTAENDYFSRLIEALICMYPSLNWDIIGLGNGHSSVRCQAITGTYVASMC